MSKKSHKGKSKEVWPDRKAHASLVHVENKLLEGLQSVRPNRVDRHGNCPECVSLEHTLADPSLAQQTAREFS